MQTGQTVRLKFLMSVLFLAILCIAGYSYRNKIIFNSITVDDEKITEIIAKEVKSKKDALIDFEKGDRQDLIVQTNEEIAILQEYLPRQLSKEEIKVEVQKVIAEIGATSMKDMGNVMKESKNRIGAAADGRTINEVVKELLN